MRKIRQVATPSFFFGLVILVVICGIAAYLTDSVPQKVSAQSSSNSPSLSGAQINVEARQRAFASLIGKAQEKGRVLVIIGFRTDFTPVGYLTKQQSAEQGARIKDVQDRFLDRFSSYAPSSVKRFDYMPYLAADVDLATLMEMQSDDEIASIQEDVPRRPSLAQSLPLIRAPQVLALGFEGLNRAVAILDTGVEKTHSFFSGRVTSEACYSKNYPPFSATSLCPGQVTSSTATGSGVNCAGAVGCDHGTHVAGIAAGNTGLARKSQIVSIQVFSRIADPAQCEFGMAPCVTTFDSDWLRALERVLVLRTQPQPILIDAVNLSLGGERFTSTAECDATYPAAKAAVDNLRSESVATIAAAGNENYTDGLNAPACISSVISVGATLNSLPDRIWIAPPFASNSSSFLTLLAPGSPITSSIPGGITGPKSGTSMATPHVTGAFAVLRSAYPLATLTRVLDALKSGPVVFDPRNGNAVPRIDMLSAYDKLGECAPDLNKYSQLFPAAGGSGTGVQVIAPAGCSWFAGTFDTPELAGAFGFGNYAGTEISASAFEPETAVSFPGTNTGAIPDGTGTVQTAGVPRNVAFAVTGMSGKPGNVEVSMTINHTWVGDLKAVLIAPNGTSFDLFGYTGASNTTSFGYGSDLLGTYIFRDTAGPIHWWDNAVINPVRTGSFRSTVSGPSAVNPNTTNLTNAFAAVTNPNGNWILRLTDGNNGDTGSVTAASLRLTNSASWITVTTPSGTGTGPLNYSVPINTSSGPRTGTIRVTGSKGTADHNITQAGSQIISVNAITFPAGRTISVDGTSQSSNTFHFWAAGTTHTVAAANQAGPAGTNYRFSQWNDNGAPTHTIAPLTDSVISAIFTTQYLLTKAASPVAGGTVGANPSPGNSFYDSGTTAQLNAVPNAGYTFSGWSGDLSGTMAQMPLAMNAPKSVTANFTAIGAVRRPFDFDGDGKTDLSIFRPSASAEWWWAKSSGGGGVVQFGNSTDKIAAADFTGDGKTDVTFWRPSTGQWFVLRSEDLTFYAFPFGSNNDIPVPGDYDADGKADAAVFRPSSSIWFISKSSGGTDIVQFGASGDRPVAADYDGDGKADIAIFRPVGAVGAEWWLRRSLTGTVFATQFGNSTDRAVVGDYTGDGKADIAFWRPSISDWFVLRSEDFSYFAFHFGNSTDIPTPGDYDGDGKTDAGIFRPSNSTWFVNKSGGGTLIQQFGSTGDLPVPNAYVR